MPTNLYGPGDNYHHINSHVIPSFIRKFHVAKDKNVSEYDVLEPPLGLIALQSYLDHVFKDEIDGKLIKSRIEFDSYDELKKIIKNFDPDLIGVSAMTFHKDFFHEAISEIRKGGYKKTLIVGGPHPTTSYAEVMKDKNIDICVLGEGEVTLAEIVQKMMENDKKKLPNEILKKINGIAFLDHPIHETKITKKDETRATGLYSSKVIGQY